MYIIILTYLRPTGAGLGYIHTYSQQELGLDIFINIMQSSHWKKRKEGNVLFNDKLNTFYLRLYGIRHMVKDHSDSEKGNPLPPYGLLFPINSKGSFICTITQTG